MPKPGRGRSPSTTSVSVRGNTSKAATECPFPKLKLHFAPDAAPASSPFSGMKAVKIGTHCGELPGEQITPKFGRLANEKAPSREALVYRLLEAAQVPSFRARPARIMYVLGDQKVERNAFFLEDDHDAMKRLGGTREIAPDEFHDAAQDIAPADAARLAFGEAMIGNFDWCLKFSANDTYRCDARRKLWNISAYAREGATALPVMGDFDIAGMVAGRHHWFRNVFYDGFVPSKSAAEIEVLSQVQRTRTLFPRDVLDTARRSFMERKAAVYEALAATTLDPAGQQTIEAYLNSFFRAIDTDAVFYAPVVARPDVRLYLDAAKSRAACGAADTLPVGTPVGAPLQTEGQMVQVAILDVLWHWAPPAKCDAIHTAPVWIDKSAIDTKYPGR